MAITWLLEPGKKILRGMGANIPNGCNIAIPGNGVVMIKPDGTLADSKGNPLTILTCYRASPVGFPIGPVSSVASGE